VGYDPVYGARPLKRAIQKELENPIATKILEEAFTEGCEVQVELTEGALDFQATCPEAITEDRSPGTPVPSAADPDPAPVV
jgi:ATP-dependent Clp protease ATP-binding subunit ClpB